MPRKTKEQLAQEVVVLAYKNTAHIQELYHLRSKLEGVTKERDELKCIIVNTERQLAYQRGVMETLYAIVFDGPTETNEVLKKQVDEVRNRVLWHTAGRGTRPQPWWRKVV